MRCAACHSKLAKKKGELDLRIQGKLYLAKNVSYEECPSCGEKVLSPEVTQFLFERIKNGNFSEQTISVPVLDGTYG